MEMIATTLILPLIFFLMTTSTVPNKGRATPAEVTRAAGSQSLDRLKDALLGYDDDASIDVLDSMHGKNPLHMAAWKGCLENIAYLLDFGCDINAISTGEFSYGKTPIFFALTQSRNDVVSFLLDRGAHVKVVNNKGQSVLSIAYSHLESSVIDKIIQHERLEERGWSNYRATHSDGLEYGDLDPRFLDRPHGDQDVITDLCVNPTTKQSRKGAFLKRNPDRLPNLKALAQVPQPTVKRTIAPSLTEEEERLLKHAWSAIDEKQFSPSSLLTIVSLSWKQQNKWVSIAADRIRSNVPQEDIDSLFQSVQPRSDREEKLLKRIYVQLQFPKGISGDPVQRGRSTEQVSPPSLAKGLWKQACLATQDLPITQLEVQALPLLVLPKSPVWIDTAVALVAMGTLLATEPVVAFDSEWFSRPYDGVLSVSTIQLAAGDRSWVVDLTVGDTDYRQSCRALLVNLFASTTMLGFACHRDLRMLSDWCGTELSNTKCLDLQLLWKDRKTPPGLAACAKEFSMKPLSKSEQCSDWSRRPLTESQHQYAGLDAAVLLYLLAEKSKM